METSKTVEIEFVGTCSPGLYIIFNRANVIDVFLPIKKKLLVIRCAVRVYRRGNVTSSRAEFLVPLVNATCHNQYSECTLIEEVPAVNQKPFEARMLRIGFGFGNWLSSRAENIACGKIDH